MEQNVPLVRRFSELEPYQAAYTLVCSLEPTGAGCWLSVSRTMARDGSAEECARLLRFLYENSIQPELWRDAISNWYPQTAAAEVLREGGASCEL